MSVFEKNANYPIWNWLNLCFSNFFLKSWYFDVTAQLCKIALMLNLSSHTTSVKKPWHNALSFSSQKTFKSRQTLCQTCLDFWSTIKRQNWEFLRVLKLSKETKMADVCHLSKKVIMCFINVGVGRCRVSHWIWRKHFNWWILEIKLAQMKQGKGNFAKRVISIMQWMTRYSEYRYTPMIFNIWYRYRWPNIFPILGLRFFNSVM